MSNKQLYRTLFLCDEYFLGIMVENKFLSINTVYISELKLSTQKLSVFDYKVCLPRNACEYCQIPTMYVPAF